jgi:hypothetical protein
MSVACVAGFIDCIVTVLLLHSNSFVTAFSLFRYCILILLVLQDSPQYAIGARRRLPSHRLRYFVGVCGSKRFDDASGNPQPVRGVAVEVEEAVDVEVDGVVVTGAVQLGLDVVSKGLGCVCEMIERIQNCGYLIYALA